MKKNILKFCKICILMIILGLTIIYGKGISFKEQMPIYDGLRNTSAIIFAVMGAWLAILYPHKLSKSLKKELDDKTDRDDRNQLFTPLIYSTIILMIVIGISFIVPIAKQILILHKYKEIIRATSFSLIGILTYLQFWSLILTLLPGDSIKDELDETSNRKKIVNRMRPGS